uniref:C-type lectin domain-containing protein n=1 Tax=Seriola lalandi dorsalis TaxID=1841481 RepID=A0A3B4XCX1_SERLL
AEPQRPGQREEPAGLDRPEAHSEHANLTQIVEYFCPTSFISKLLPEASQQYHLITGSLTWHEARSFCRVKYTDLAAVNNMDDKNRLVNMLGGRVAHTWIGLHKGAADRWMWSDGSGRAHFTKWKEGEPNNVAGDEWCGEMSETEAWNDMSCGDKKYFVCYERELMTHSKVIQKDVSSSLLSSSCRCASSAPHLAFHSSSLARTSTWAFVRACLFLMLLLSSSSF